MYKPPLKYFTSVKNKRNLPYEKQLAKVILLLLTVASLLTVNCGGSGPGDVGKGSGPTSYSISGTLTSAGSPMPGVTISISSYAPVQTDSNGNYIISGLPNGIYTVTPSETGFTFTPFNKNLSIKGSDVVGVNFTSP
jgi:hypothetical protein